MRIRPTTRYEIRSFQSRSSRTGRSSRGETSGTWTRPAERRLDLRLFLLPLGLVDHLLRDVRRHLLVAEEVHVVVAAAAGERGQGLRVREDVRHRDLGLDRRHPAARLHALEPPPP